VRRALRVLLGLLAAAVVGALGWKLAQGLAHPPAPRLHSYENRGQRATVDRGAYRSAEFCGSCHEEILRQWKESYLSRAWTQAATEVWLHQITLRLKGTKPQEIRFCLECHAPLALAAPEDLEVVDPLGQEGVTCVVCHSATEVWADPNPARMVNDPHAGMGGPFADAVSPWHRTTTPAHIRRWDNALCGTCHASKWPPTGLPIDWTWEEWREVADPARENCVECHMPAYRGQAAQLEGVPERDLRRHSFPGGHDPAMVAEAATLAFVEIRRAAGGLELVVDVENRAGHDLPSGNPPAPEVRLRACAGACPPEGGALAARSYRASQLMADGSPTYDVTIAAAQGPSTALRPWETRREVLELPSGTRGVVEVRADFSYWRPTEPSQRWTSYVRTIRQHVLNPQVSLGRLTATLLRPQTWAVLAEAFGQSKGEPMPVDALRVDLDAGTAVRWDEGGFELVR